MKERIVLLVVIPCESKDSKIVSKTSNEKYRDNYDTIFGKQKAGQA